MKHPEIKLSQLLGIKTPHAYTLHAASWNGKEHPLVAYLRDPAAWRTEDPWRGERDACSRHYITSLIDLYPEPDTWLFVGIYEVVQPNSSSTDTITDSSCESSECAHYIPYSGRLKITLPRPPRGRIFPLEQYLDDMHVAAILPAPYTGQPGNRR